MIDLFSYLLFTTLGYIISFILAVFIAPKLANKLSGKFSLYTSMIILSIAILLSFSLSLALIFHFFGAEIIYLLPIVLIYALVANVVIYIISPWIIDMTFFAKKNDYLQNLVNEIAKSSGYKGKITALVAQGPPNAFAYGNFISGKKIAVTESLIKILNEEELKAVIGHEIGHHRHRDSIFMILFGLLPTIIYYLGIIMIRSSIISSGNRRNRGGLMALLGIFLVIMSFVVQILVLAFSRLREYYADYFGAKSTSKKNMQKALAKLFIYYKNNRSILERVKDSPMSTLFIYALTSPLVDITDIDLERIKELKEFNYIEIFQSHPPIPKRLKFLDQIKELF